MAGFRARRLSKLRSDQSLGASKNLTIVRDTHGSRAVGLWMKCSQSLRQYQLTLPRPTQAVDLAPVLDPNLIAAAGEFLEADDLWQASE